MSLLMHQYQIRNSTTTPVLQNHHEPRMFLTERRCCPGVELIFKKDGKP
ncbi:hypothetical protein T07_10928 [Trichinella nelsoni]|uniref:Uncharacterized protein n=1 Tax=Trichinella nelsoni TaxID=6336 RepID=A0A0V0RLX7_9BILA|nr:hypothetical protein T07_10928 [Trichinella nelsoni]